MSFPPPHLIPLPTTPLTTPLRPRFSPSMETTPPPPFNGSPPPNSNFPILAIAIIGILATAFLLVSYYIFVIKCCLTWHRIDFLRRFSLSRRRISGDDPIAAYSPAAVSRGLDESLIRLIPVIRFQKETSKDEETEYIECSICLSDFKEGEKLRVIPICCHAFHIDCIDVWLQGNANCPVCRSGITSSTLCAIPKNPTESLNPERFTGNDDDYVVIDITDNNLDEPRLVVCDERRSSSEDWSTISITPSPWKAEHGRKDAQTSFDDECIKRRTKGEEFESVHPMRRSISMDLSSRRQLCSEIREVLEKTTSSGNEGSSSSSKGTRRSFFSFGNGRGGSRNAVLPLGFDS